MVLTVPNSCQVYTPVPLAQAMVDALLQVTPQSWLEPSVGRGVFVEAIRKRGVESGRVTGLELDMCLRPPSIDFGEIQFGVDALAWMSESSQKFDAIVGNPPYLSLSELPPEMREAALSVVELSGRSLRLGSNLWLAFVLSAVARLKRGGALSFVLPASWDYADYAREVRDLLPKCFETFHVFRSAKPLFDEVSEGSIVILGTGYRLQHRYSSRVQCTDLSAVCAALLDFKVGVRPQLPATPTQLATMGSPSLGDYLSIRLGGVTGDSNYFTLTESQRKEHGLPVTALRQIVSRARHLSWPEIGREQWNTLRKNEQKVWLFRPTQSCLSHLAVRRYLRLKPDDGGCDRERFKVSTRIPWHRTPLPLRVDGFISGMTTQGPRISFSDLPRLSATNTLYVVSFLPKLTVEERRNIALQLLGEGVKEQLHLLQRTYAGGMKKMEPGDLLRLKVQEPSRRVGKREYRRAFAASTR